MNLDHDFVQVSKLSEDPKKGPHQKWSTFFPKFRWRPKKKEKKGLHQQRNTFSPNSSGHLRSDAHRSQIIGEDADVHHTVLKLIPPPGFGTPAGNERLLVAYC